MSVAICGADESIVIEFMVVCGADAGSMVWTWSLGQRVQTTSRSDLRYFGQISYLFMLVQN
jgi:hypothetical protein